MQAGDQWPDEGEKWQKVSRVRRFLGRAGSCCICTLRCMRRWIKKLVEHKYFQQGILLAILINTLSMGIEYHNQVTVRFDPGIVANTREFLPRPSGHRIIVYRVTNYTIVCDENDLVR